MKLHGRAVLVARFLTQCVNVIENHMVLVLCAVRLHIYLRPVLGGH